MRRASPRSGWARRWATYGKRAGHGSTRGSGVLAVSKSTGLPTEGLFIGVEGFSMNVKSPDFVVWWQAMVDRVYATDWSAFELPPDEQ